MIRRFGMMGLVLLLGGTLTVASGRGKKKLPASKLFCQASYAYVRTMDGDVVNPNVLPEDRDAAVDLERRLQDWKRYTLVYRSDMADLVFVVRTGRLGSLKGQGRMGTGGPYPGGAVQVGRNPGAQNPSGQNPGQNPGAAGEYPDEAGGGGPGLGAEVGPPDDWLEVYTSGPGDAPHTILWEHTEHHGLTGPQMPLLERLRDAVETTCQDQDGKSKP